MGNNNIITCVRCAVDSSIPGVSFDDHGECNHCKIYDKLATRFKNDNERREKLDNIIEKIKIDGKNKEYDSIVGISGGQDSSYTLYMAKKLGLNPLAVHFDNGWNTEQSVRNIKKITSKLDVDLFTYVVDWEEFKDIQISFLKASVSDAEIPTDIGIKATLYKVANDNKIKYILYSGSNFKTEGVIPIDWTYMDGKYINSVQKLFGNKKLISYPNSYLSDLVYYFFIKRIKIIKLFDVIDFKSNNVLKILKDELDWEYYGGKHYESNYTKFFQYYILPNKFNIDKRRIHYSALIRSGQKSRDEVLNDLDKAPCVDQDVALDKEFVCKKLDLSIDEFDRLMALPIKSFHDYSTYYPIVKILRPLINIFKKIKIWPKIG